MNSRRTRMPRHNANPTAATVRIDCAAITTPDETDAMLLFKSASMKFNIEHESTIEIAIKSLDLSSAASEVDDL